MAFKETKTYKELLKIIKINLIISVIFSFLSIPSIAISTRESSFWIILLYIMCAIIGAIIFFFPISFIYFIFAFIDEFVINEFKTPKVILKIAAVHIFPAMGFILGGYCESIKYKSGMCGIFNEFGIIFWVYILISIPFSIIYLINAIISDLVKKFKK